MNEKILEFLACPLDRSELSFQDGSLKCKSGHGFAVEDGIPVFTDAVRRERVPHNMRPCQYRNPKSGIDSFVDDWLINTNGNLYWRARGNLRRYPIPRWPFALGKGQVMVDIGCSWGRWSIAAARAGFFAIGIDVHIDALVAAGRVSRQVQAKTDFVCGDVEHLPLRLASVDMVFSYSVLQHLDRGKVARFFREASRVLKPGGTCLVQMPNASGLYNKVLQAKRGFRDAEQGTFEMRYWSRSQIRQAIESAGLQNLKVYADGFFSQNPQLSDVDLFSPLGKVVALASYAGRKAAHTLPIVTRLADSIWVETQAP